RPTAGSARRSPALRSSPTILVASSGYNSILPPRSASTLTAQPGVPRGGQPARQPPQVDEALCQGLVEHVALVVRGQAEVVETRLRPPAGNSRSAPGQDETHLTRDVVLSFRDERVERLLQRREPQA